jgi:DNA-binding NarL/FixJ family response regulator
VLLVDDHKMLLDLLEKVLSKYLDIVVVEKVTNGELALSYCTKYRPQIVLLDINIGIPDGFEIAKQIRKTSLGTRVIALSMFAQPAYAKKFLRSGGSGYVTKSSPIEELVEAIHSVRSGNTFLCKQIKDACNCENHESLANDNPAAMLSQREIEIIHLIRNGDTSKEIAEKLFVTPKTVDLHRHNILQKLNIKNTAALITFAYQQCI